VNAAVHAALPATPAQRLDYLLHLGDTSLVLGQRLGEWVGHAPALEEDLGLANVALDLVGQARLLLTYAGEIEGRGRDEDALAFLREEAEYRNPTLVELPNGDFGLTIARQALIDAWQLEVYERLQASRDERLAAIAGKAVKETRYHLRYSGGWLVRLGDGTDESHARAQDALNRLWPYTQELCHETDAERALAAAGIAPPLTEVGAAWSARVGELLERATLKRPSAAPYRWSGKAGRHSEHLSYLLAEMQYLQRTHPGAKW
jgi:ring-1,2-phenylacetyl-CoA epoxidase subunit PaaC